ncbi:hypothetical protein ABPG72_014345 [Tetrahymena utriculariae]
MSCYDDDNNLKVSQQYQNESLLSEQQQQVKQEEEGEKQGFLNFPKYSLLSNDKEVECIKTMVEFEISQENQLDQQQKVALRRALYNKNANIQVPAGTSEIILASKIVNLLSKIHYKHTKKPLLVISQKNKSLDQLLLKVRYQDDSIRILRLGKTTIIENFTLSRQNGPSQTLPNCQNDLEQEIDQEFQEYIKNIKNRNDCFRFLQQKETDLLKEIKYSIKKKLIDLLRKELDEQNNVIENNIQEKILKAWSEGKLDFRKLQKYLKNLIFNQMIKILKFVKNIKIFEELSVEFSKFLLEKQDDIELNIIQNKMKYFDNSRKKQITLQGRKYSNELSSIMENYQVIGMTFRGYHTNVEAIQKLSPEIIVVEAMEAIESSFYPLLNPNCKHLIQIGYHNQQRILIKEESLQNNYIDFPPQKLLYQPLGITPYIPKDYQFDNEDQYIETMFKLEYENYFTQLRRSLKKQIQEIHLEKQENKFDDCIVISNYIIEDIQFQSSGLMLFVNISIKTPRYLMEKVKILPNQLMIFVSKKSHDIFLGKTHIQGEQQIDNELTEENEDVDSSQQDSDKNYVNEFEIIEILQKVQIRMNISNQIKEFFYCLHDIKSNFIFIAPKDYWLSVEKNLNCILQFKQISKIAFPDQTLKGQQGDFQIPLYKFLNCHSITQKYLQKLDDAIKSEPLLNNSQKNALAYALRKQNAVIQGPPGTGKTFLACTIAKILIKVYKFFSGKPILIICQKNQSLDELLLKINKADDQIKILRLGTRFTKDEVEYFTAKYQGGPKIQQSHLQNSFFAELINKKQLQEFKLFQSIKEKFIQELKKIFCYDICITQKIEEKIFCKWFYGELDFNKLKNYLIQSNVILNDSQERIFKSFIEKQQQNKYFHLVKNEYQIKSFVEKITSFDQFSKGFSQFLSNNYNIQKVKDIIKDMKLEQDQNLNQKSNNETNQQLKLSKFMQKYDVICMTMTGYHMNFQALQKLRAEIVLVEEASEIIESQFFPILTQNLKHLIQIGDHKQLRPLIKNQMLQKKYNYKMSYFERLIQINKIEIMTLNEQRRMLPWFANITRIFYGKEYVDARCTKELEIIQEISKDGMYILQHSYPDKIDGANSFINIFEALFIKQFLLDLVKKYKNSQISVITTYLSQKILIKSIINSTKNIQEIGVYTVDQFQGNENDIIILSCVRSNIENQCGFVLDDHRINVAFSRAKRGFFGIGNFNMFALKSNSWKKIIKISGIQFSFGGDKVGGMYKKIAAKTSKKMDESKQSISLKLYEICNSCLKRSHVGNCKSHNF